MKLIARFIDVGFGVAAVLLFALSITTFIKLNTSDYTYLQGVGTNWMNGPIIALNTDTLTCRIGEDNLIDDQWHGTTDGCYCPYSLDIFYGALRERSCNNKRDSLILCSNVKSVSAIKYTNWRGRQLCAVRQGGTYMDLIIAQNDKSCPMDHKPCGIIDSLNNVLCIPNRQDCPMNEVKTLPSSVTVPTDKKYSIVKADGVNFYFSNENTKGRIVNQFKVSDEQPCILPYYENMKGKLYLLDFMKSRNTCKRGVGKQVEDNRYVKIDTYNKKNLFNDNNIVNLVNTLPEFSLNDYSVPTNLYVKDYIGVNPACVKEMKQSSNAQTVINQLMYMESNMGATLTLSIAILVLEVISFFFAIGYVIFGFIKSDLSEAFKLIISCCPITLNIAAFIICIILNGQIRQYSQQFSLFSEQSCVDEVTFSAFNNFESSVGIAKVSNFVVTGLSCFSIVSPIVSQILLKYYS